ncbi:MAG: Hsp20/alpha crystallin family protein [Bacillota bacterium]|jgi:HSP20 family protein|nr:Hsp20/alpha crystallin family protein [Bacillota bacterium]
MTLMNWDPWRDLADIRSIYNRVFGEGLWPRLPGDAQLGAASWYMPVDVAETADKYVLKAEMPGMRAEDIEVTVTESQVTIKGRRDESREEKGVNYVRSERRFGTFSRTVSLGVPVDANKVDASYRDGVLEIHLPKVQSTVPKQITIRTE